MKKSPKEQIELVLGILETAKGVPMNEAIELAISHPEAISDLAIILMERFPSGGTFFDQTLSYLPQEDWDHLVRHALDVLELSSGKNEIALSVIHQASFQSLSSLHPHLTRIFLLRADTDCFYCSFHPWKESGDQHFEFLKKIAKTTSTSQEGIRWRRWAWEAILETRQPNLINFAISCPDLENIAPTEISREEWIQWRLHEVGFDQKGNSLRNLCPESLFHIQFQKRAAKQDPQDLWLAKTHPTWNLSSSNHSIPFGGSSEGRCALCGEKLHRLIMLDPIPVGLGVTGLHSLEMATCHSCLGWERAPLFYRHSQDGSLANIGYDGPRITPEFSSEPLELSEVRLAKTPKHWYWQDWGGSNDRENLNRIGGEPCWIQNADYFDCPSCQRLMPFLMQLDSYLRADGWLWGSGGIAYVYWCDLCKISAWYWQCT